ncbi:MAG: amidohydrolase [Herpetosiphon sp.]
MSDLLLHNGAIHTLDPARPLVDALLIRDDRIIATGTASDIRAALNGTYDDIDLHGRAVVPGLTDAHIHLLSAALGASSVDLDGVATLEAALDKIHDHALSLPPAAWLRGHGWNHSLWEHRWPTAADLDRVTAGRPALLTRKDGHSIWLNSRALALTGITAATKPPPGGAIQRDDHGTPTGILSETATNLAYAVIPPPSQTDQLAFLRAAVAQCNRYGLTSVHMPEGPDGLRLMRMLHEAGDRSLRALCHLRYDQLDHAIALGLRSAHGDPWVRVGGVKIFSDGSLGSCTCHMLAPFANSATNHGIATVPEDELHASVLKAATHGISVAIHAIGDRANRAVLDAIAHPAVAAAHCALPHRVEHAQHLDRRDIPRFAAAGIIASMQPIHATSDINIAERLLGPERCATAYPWRPLLATGAILAFGSDAPVETFDPWQGIYAAITRCRADGTPRGGWYPELAVDLDAAVNAYTVGPALASGEADFKGRLSPGFLADLIVLDRDPWSVESDALRGITVDHTFVGGAAVWHS